MGAAEKSEFVFEDKLSSFYDKLSPEFTNLSTWQRHVFELPAFSELKNIAHSISTIEELSCALDATNCVQICVSEACGACLKSAVDGFFVSPFAGAYSDFGSSIFSTTEIYRDDEFSFILMAVDSVRLAASRLQLAENVELNGSLSSYKVLGSGKIKLTIVETQGFDDNTDFAEKISVLSEASIVLDENSPWFSIDGRTHGFRIDEVHGNVTMAILGLHHENCGFRVIINSSGGNVISLKPFYQTDSKIMSILDTFATLNHKYFLEIYKIFVDSKMFFIRAQAIRLLCAVAPSIAKSEISERLKIEKNPMAIRNLQRLMEWLN